MAVIGTTGVLYNVLRLLPMALGATMRGVVYDGIPYQVAVIELNMPVMKSPEDVIVRMKTSAICGTDMRIYHGLEGDSLPIVMGHEGLGVVTEVGDAVRFHSVGDVVVIPDNIDSGHLNMKTPPLNVFGFGGELGGLQAEFARVPFADESLIPVPLTFTSTDVDLEEDYATLSDIFATGWTALDFADFRPGDSVAVFGAGPVGLLAAYSAVLRGANKVYAVDNVPMRLQRAASIGAIPINFNTSDPVQQILEHEPAGVPRAVDCVGMEAVDQDGKLQEGIVLHQMIAVAAEHGGLGQVGIYHAGKKSHTIPRADVVRLDVPFPLSTFWTKGLSLKDGVVNPRVLAPQLAELIATGRAQPGFIRSATIGLEQAPEYYMRFSQHEEVKVYIRFDW